MDIYDREHLKQFLVTLFGQQAASWHPNEQLFNLTYELVEESGSCSEAIKYVPGPLGPARNAYKWMAREARSKFLQALSENRDHYTICIGAAAYRMVHRFQLAAQGV
ncbi:hypothetical protein [Marinobacter sp. F3R11]|uniref:hypothetical protein n=1 Tax=Marinobacter sp. F3R11 TaxID=2267231 RepID=UPI0011E5E4A5|nr:hypothetical protein [Marinobacter sp. F3R11]